MQKVLVEEIPELRAYNATRDDLRRSIMALKARRRVFLGTFVTVVFENTDTVRWQITEMMRAERIDTDAGIATEVEQYNDLIPGDAQLSCTMFIELTDDESMREWLPKLVGIHEAIEIPKLVGIHEAIEIRLPNGDVVRGYDPHAERLTREEATAAVHFLKFDFTPEQIVAFRRGPVAIASVHPAYREETVLNLDQHDALCADFD